MVVFSSIVLVLFIFTVQKEVFVNVGITFERICFEVCLGLFLISVASDMSGLDSEILDMTVIGLCFVSIGTQVIVIFIQFVTALKQFITRQRKLKNFKSLNLKETCATAKTPDLLTTPGRENQV